jgi:dihydroorotate dehydrogenase
MSRDDGQAMLDAGASLLQVYTGYIYRGPSLVNDLNHLKPGRAPTCLKKRASEASTSPSGELC